MQIAFQFRCYILENPITTVFTFAFIFHSLWISSLWFCYFSSFSLSCWIAAVLLVLLRTKMSELDTGLQSIHVYRQDHPSEDPV